MRPSEFKFSDRYTTLEGTIILTGIQALVRIPIDQTRKDTKEGIKLGTYVTGYQGSPLGTVDTSFNQVPALLQEYHIRFQAGINEDLAATAINGTQLIESLPHSEYDGVLGMWYGKGPGVDRSGDAFRHANFTGTSPYGAVLVFAGDDPSCKSSTVPSDTTPILYNLSMPVLFPGNQQETLELGLKGVGLSRYSGLWTSIKIVTDVADSGSIIEVYPEQALQIMPSFEIDGKPFQKHMDLAPLPGTSLEVERQIFYEKTAAAKAYAYENELDKIMIQSENDQLGLISFGKTYYDLMQAIDLLGLNEQDLKEAGVRVYKMGMIAPVEPRRLKEFSEGLEEIMVVEEKGGFTEMLIRNELFNLPDHPQIFGKQDREGKILLHAHNELKVSEVISALVNFLGEKRPGLNLATRAKKMIEIQTRHYEPMMPRIPYFCSGCPHNSSTLNPEGEISGGGIGCHAMAVWMGRGVQFLTHMGGEGANWIGLSQFTEKEHFFQNVGDGTYFHSASKAIEACVASGVNITYKILYNSTVAMTGGQNVAGGLDPVSLAKKLALEGVKKVVIVAELLEKYPEKQINETVSVVSKDEYQPVLEEMKQIKGVTSIIYDQECAAEKRRKRKRGLLATPRTRVAINESICEGCGDCGVKSNCLSVIPISTEYGRKTQIHESSCNFDYACLKGDCPSFMSIELEAGADKIKKAVSLKMIENSELPEPENKYDSKVPYRILMVGIGGTGVVTTSSILVAAAYLEGKYASQLDQTGLAQKGGAVTANLTICDEPFDASIKLPSGTTDLLLAFDVLASVSADNLDRLSADRTLAVVNSHQIDTAMTVTNISANFPKQALLQHQLGNHTKADQNIYLDANNVSETLFNTAQFSNVFMLGAAYQVGRIPMSAQYIEAAIIGNGVSVNQNLNAFRWGRKYILDPQKTMQILDQDTESKEPAEKRAIAKLRKYESSNVSQLEALAKQFPGNGNLKDILYPRVSDLILYQDVQYAQRYLDFIQEIYQTEINQLSLAKDDTIFTETVAKWLFKLMAYKDEYEVARLWIQDPAVERANTAYEGKVKVAIHLHPPILRELGMKNKIKLGSWIFPFLKILARFKTLRGSKFDLFGKADIRQEEVALIPWYQDLVRQVMPGLASENLQSAIVLASLPDDIRGYEDIKMQNITKTKQQADEKLKDYLSMEPLASEQPSAESTQRDLPSSETKKDTLSVNE